jgi:hypothetical protein
MQLYHSDRLLSLIVGLPYSIANSHRTLTFGGHALLTSRTALSLPIRFAHLAGKIIDQAQQTTRAPAVSTIFAPDKELDECASVRAERNWKVDATAPKDDASAHI